MKKKKYIYFFNKKNTITLAADVCTCASVLAAGAHARRLYNGRSSECRLYKHVRTQYNFSFSLLCCPRNNLHTLPTPIESRRETRHQRIEPTRTINPRAVPYDNTVRPDFSARRFRSEIFFESNSVCNLEFGRRKKKKLEKWCTHV